MVSPSPSLPHDETTLRALAEETHFHGIAVDPREPGRLYLATHHGLYTVTPDGKARRISETPDDFMGFTPHPADPAVLYASGHPTGGGNLGFIASADGGVSWAKLADGAGGPVDFHQMDVSKADPKVIYGVYGDHLEKSTDGGRTWARVGPAPEGTVDLAASSMDADTVYAATQDGLLVSSDSGGHWRAAHGSRLPATMVHVTPSGAIYAFIVGTGLVYAREPALSWQTVSNSFGGAVLLHLSVAPDQEGLLYAVTLNPETRAQALYASRDAGRSWAPLGLE